MGRSSSKFRPVPPGRDFRREQKEPVFEQIASFVGFFIYLLVLKSFLLPLFIIPTGSMAETLYGAHATHTCPNCGVDFPVQMPPRDRYVLTQCPNCRWHEYFGSEYDLGRARANGAVIDALSRGSLREQAGDRIMVHGWPYDLGGAFAPQRWDVVVFKVPSDGQTNYIKRLIGRPGETIEIIDGDIFVTDPQTTVPHIARKTPEAQTSLWFSYYNHDYPPRQAGSGGTYRPRWVALTEDGGWSALNTRQPRFDGLGGRGDEILFVTDPDPGRQPGQITDVYGYDGPYSNGVRSHVVSDVRLSCEVTFEQADPDGFVELAATKYADQFFARLAADGRVTLEHARGGSAQRDLWGERKLTPARGPLRLALSSVDYVVSVEIDGRPVDGLRSTPAQYDVTAERARTQSQSRATPRLTIAAHDARASLAHVLIERDVFYTSDVLIYGGRGDQDHAKLPKEKDEGQPGYGTQGNPIALGEHDYFVLGDNSPASLDARFSFAQPGSDPVGPHLKQAFERGDYHVGTVPADQLIGPAFLVYWPGTAALLPDESLPRALRVLNQLPDPGRVRWIR